MMQQKKSAEDIVRQDTFWITRLSITDNPRLKPVEVRMIGHYRHDLGATVVKVAAVHPILPHLGIEQFLVGVEPNKVFATRDDAEEYCVIRKLRK